MIKQSKEIRSRKLKNKLSSGAHNYVRSKIELKSCKSRLLILEIPGACKWTNGKLLPWNTLAELTIGINGKVRKTKEEWKWVVK